MRTYIIRENTEAVGVSLAFSVDAMPTQNIADYSDAESAIRENPDLPWHEVTDEERETEDIGGDVLYVAEVQ